MEPPILKYDAVIAGELLEHVRFPDQLVAEAHRILRPGGILLGSVPNVYNLHNRTGGSADNINQTYSVNVGAKARAGTWNLRVRDRGASDVGRIDSWKITLPAAVQ